MIHHFSAIQKQQLLCWQFRECRIKVCKMTPFSWKAASENNLRNLGRNRSQIYSSIKGAAAAMFGHFTLHYCIINMYDYITKIVLRLKVIYCVSSIQIRPVKSERFSVIPGRSHGGFFSHAYLPATHRIRSMRCLCLLETAPRPDHTYSTCKCTHTFSTL